MALTAEVTVPGTAQVALIPTHTIAPTILILTTLGPITQTAHITVIVPTILVLITLVARITLIVPIILVLITLVAHITLIARITLGPITQITQTRRRALKRRSAQIKRSAPIRSDTVFEAERHLVVSLVVNWTSEIRI